MAFDHRTFLSPLTWRYGSEAMRKVWSQTHQRRLWRRVWVALAEAQTEVGLITAEQLADIRTHEEDIDLERAQAIEDEIRHDLMAELRTFAEQCAVGGGVLHLGATSADIQDNADALRLRAAFELVIEGLRALLETLADRIDQWADTVTIGFTHLQPAEPTTVGYRLAHYGQDLLIDWREIRRTSDNIRGKGIKGAVGTAASYAELLDGTAWTPAQLEARVLERLGLQAFSVTTQVSPRKQDWFVVMALAGLAASLHKMMFDLRILQSPPIGEWSEPFRARQVGSSAMPFKRNPVKAENVDSLARWIAALPHIAWQNAALSLLERTLDDSANRRLMLPEAFIVVDEILGVSQNVVEGLRVNQEAIAQNIRTYGTFAAVERLLMALGKAGADRQTMHERLREHSMAAWQQITQGEPNRLCEMLNADVEIARYISTEEVRSLLDASQHVGDAPVRARRMAAEIRQELGLISG